MNTKIVNTTHLEFNRKNLRFPMPRSTNEQDTNEDTREDNSTSEGGFNDGEEVEGPDENERMKDGFESQEDR